MCWVLLLLLDREAPCWPTPHLARAYRAPAWTSSLRSLTTAWFIAGVTPHLEVTKSCALSPGAGAAGELGAQAGRGSGDLVSFST